MKEWTLSASSLADVGTVFDVSEKAWRRPFASIGGTFPHDGDLDKNTSFGSEVRRFTANCSNYTRHEASGCMSIKF